MIVHKKGRQLSLAERVDPAHTALIVVDVQNDFAMPEGVLGKSGCDVSAAAPMVERLKPLIDDARKAGLLVVYVRACYDEPVLSRPLAEQYARRGYTESCCLTGTWGAEFVEGIGPKGLPNEVVVTKHRYSTFWGTDIDLILRSNGIETVVVTGIVTEVCVESTARDAFFRDYFLVEAADCACGYAEAPGKASQAALDDIFGYVLPSGDLRAVWAAAKPGPRGWQPETKAAKMLKTLEDRVDPKHAALVIIDVQNDFCHPEGATAKAGNAIKMYQETVPRIRNLLLAARRAGTMVIFVKAEYGAMYRHVGSPYRYPRGPSRDKLVWTASAAEIQPGEPLSNSDPEVCLPGTWGGQIMDEIAPQGDEQVVVKHRYSAFVDTRLDLLLRSNDIRTVILTGVTTNCCVESTARDAAMRDYYLVVAEDCVATPDSAKHLHQPTLENLRYLFGLVEPSSRITAAWEGKAAAVA